MRLDFSAPLFKVSLFQNSVSCGTGFGKKRPKARFFKNGGWEAMDKRSFAMRSLDKLFRVRYILYQCKSSVNFAK
jgi:hypothetical protein